MGYGFHSYVPKGKGQDSPEQVLQSAPFLLWIPKMVDSQVTMSFNMFQYVSIPKWSNLKDLGDHFRQYQNREYHNRFGQSRSQTTNIEGQEGVLKTAHLTSQILITFAEYFLCRSSYPYAPCMEYLPTFTVFTSKKAQM